MRTRRCGARLAVGLWALCGAGPMAATTTRPTFVTVPAGSFDMGSDHGDVDERPVHRVTITRPLAVGATPVTNAQYEAFDPAHRSLRGKAGFSRDDDEAVVFVSHDEATAYCRWLSGQLGVPCRLPTEAEWEYAARAGTTTAYHTGDRLPDDRRTNAVGEWGPKPQPLHVGRHGPNGWGLYDVHGPVEQWCGDWYGPYAAGPAADPVGRASGDFRVTRGGSCNTPVRYLRSANRLGTVPIDRSWLIGFRVVQGEPLATAPLPPPASPTWARDVSQTPAKWEPAGDVPYFAGPVPFVRLPPGGGGPLFAEHVHCPSIVACPNGDLLATFYTCRTEDGRELTVAASRLRRGAGEWDVAGVFYKAPDRNMHATTVWADDHGLLWHFQGISVAQGWESLALLCRTSGDSGATWSPPRWIDAEHRLRNMPVATAIGLADGHTIVLPCDAVTGGEGGTAVHVSGDGGRTWADPGAGTPPPNFVAGATGGTIAGIHAKVVELRDGRLLALGRGNAIGGHMPASTSADGGRTWTYAPTPFGPITGGQRLVLMRLREGPLLLVSFANDAGMAFTDGAGRTFTGHGMFAAVSRDDGATWPVRKLLTPGVAGPFDGRGWTGVFRTDASHAEPKGYLAACQSGDGVVQLVSSGLHYRFNLAWLARANDGS